MLKTQKNETGIELIAAERERQIHGEGWTAKHDDKHRGGEMACAAACYAMTPHVRDYDRDCAPGSAHACFVSRLDEVWSYTGWARKWWKPSPDNRVRELVKAGALIAAEIDRLQRVK